MLENQLQGENRRFDKMVHKEKQNAKRDKGTFFGVYNGQAEDQGNDQNGNKG